MTLMLRSSFFLLTLSSINGETGTFINELASRTIIWTIIVENGYFVGIYMHYNYNGIRPKHQNFNEIAVNNLLSCITAHHTIARVPSQNNSQSSSLPSSSVAFSSALSAFTAYSGAGCQHFVDGNWTLTSFSSCWHGGRICCTLNIGVRIIFRRVSSICSICSSWQQPVCHLLLERIVLFPIKVAIPKRAINVTWAIYVC